MAAEESRAEEIVRAQTPLLLGIENRKRKGTGKGGPDNDRFNFKGVRQRVSGKWVAEITVPKMPGIQRTRKWLGTFATAQDAALAYEQAAFALNGSPVQLNGSRAHMNDLHPSSYSAECPPVSSDSTTLGPLLSCPPALNPCPDPQTLIQSQHPFLLSSFNQSGAAVQVNPILGGAMLLPATSMQTNNQNLHQLALPQSAMNSEQALNFATTMQPLSGFQVSGAMLPATAMQHYTSNIHEDLASDLFSFEGHYISNIHEDLASGLFSLEGLPAVTTKSQPPNDLCKSHGVAACMTVMDQVPPFPDFNWDLEKARKDHLEKAMETMDDENLSMWDSDDPFGSMWGF